MKRNPCHKTKKLGSNIKVLKIISSNYINNINNINENKDRIVVKDELSTIQRERKYKRKNHISNIKENSK